ncbi:hypothetical protein HDU87_008549 [Geranomyces variabilis]|uniref:DUF6593 domain-containing protein n=1 Tax=Geranomyces variabilis TaxID=109894 RepID=A0AAD5TR23_9FUNG|nr:hypothetical protein HDU87_008549 [Geranomyces variabilis]
MSQAPPAYEAGSSSADVTYPADIKPGTVDTRSYAVDNAGSGIYPNATEHYVPPTAEPESHQYESALVPSAPSAAVLAEKRPSFLARHITHRKEFKQDKPLPAAPTVQQQSTEVVQQSVTNEALPSGGVASTMQTVYQGPYPLPANSVTFNIHRTGWISRDCKILHADNKTPAYHIDHPYSFFGAWHVNMRRGDSHGPVVFLINKSAVGSEFSIQDPVNPGLSAKIVRTGGIIGKRKHEFKAFDGRKYAWKLDAAGGDMTLVCYPEKSMVARVYRAHHSWSKVARVEVLPNGSHIMDLIVASGLCVEEWEKHH